MEILINDKVKISDIQETFGNMFPFLRIEFFTKVHKTAAGRYAHPGPNNRTVAFYRATHAEGKIRIVPSMTVLQMEQDFKNRFDLIIQLFRKSGKLWLETTLTKNWTLEQQNNEGKALSDGK